MSLTPTPLRHNRAYALSGATLDALIRALITRIVGGRGVRTRQAGGQVIIEADPRGGWTPAQESDVELVRLFDDYADMITDLTTGQLGLTLDRRYLYIRDGTQWRILHPFRQADAPDGIGELDGDAWYDTANHVLYRRINGEWIPDSHFEEPPWH